MPTVDEELNGLERDLRTMKIEYEQYFGGGRPRPPSDTIWRIEQVIKKYGERAAELNFGQRYRYNTLASTYAKYADMFRKRMKAREEGREVKHFGAAAREIAAQRAKSAPPPPPPPPEPSARRAAAGAAGGFTMATADPGKEGEKVQKLYEALIEAKKTAGEKTDGLTLDSFKKFVTSKTDQLKGQKGKEVEFAVSTEGGQVKLKARVK
jgi:hypothetical protein